MTIMRTDRSQGIGESTKGTEVGRVTTRASHPKGNKMRQRLASLVLFCLVSPATAQTEAIQRLASQLNDAPVVDIPYILPQDTGKQLILTEHVMSDASEPERIGSAATERVRYQYDDNTFEAGMGTLGYAIQVAQRFRLQDTGTIRWLEACFWRRLEDTVSSHAFVFDILSDRNGSPGSSIVGDQELAESGQIASNQRDTCLRLSYSQRLSTRTVWVAVLFFGDDGLEQNGFSGLGKRLSADRSGSRSTSVKVRPIEGTGGQVTSVGAWQDPDGINAVGIRIAVDHETEDPQPPPPDPDPDPDPDPGSGCTPTTTVLSFDGGYDVSMCYRTPQGEEGQAKSGIWASGQAGLLWFFDRGNAEVLVKVLDGCAHNGHRWVFVAPVTDLEFNLWITGPNGKRWTHSNQQGITASTKSHTSAFPCG